MDIDKFLRTNRKAHLEVMDVWGKDTNQDREDDFDKSKLKVLMVFLSTLRIRSHSSTYTCVSTLMKDKLEDGSSLFVDACWFHSRSFRGILEENGVPQLFGNVSHRSWEEYDIVAISHAICPEVFNVPIMYSKSGMPMSKEERFASGAPIILYGGAAASSMLGVLGGKIEGHGRSFYDYGIIGSGENIIPDFFKMLYDMNLVSPLKGNKEAVTEAILNHPSFHKQVVIPWLYDVEFKEDNISISKINRLDSRIPEKIEINKIRFPSFKGFNKKFFAPNGTNAYAHDVQISSGCSSYGCSFSVTGETTVNVYGEGDTPIAKVFEKYKDKDFKVQTLVGFESAKVFEVGCGDTYKVQVGFDSPSILDCSQDHKWLKMRDDFSLVETTSECLEVGDIVLVVCPETALDGVDLVPKLLKDLEIDGMDNLVYDRLMRLPRDQKRRVLSSILPSLDGGNIDVQIRTYKNHVKFLKNCGYDVEVGLGMSDSHQLYYSTAKDSFYDYDGWDVPVKDLEFYPREVSRITYGSEVVPMFDILVEGSHTCVYNDILTHNCAEGQEAGHWTEKSIEEVAKDVQESKRYSAANNFTPFSFNSNYYGAYYDMLKLFIENGSAVSLLNQRADVIGEEPRYLDLAKKLGLVRVSMAVEGSLAAHMRVLTDTGYKAISSISIGDTVVSRNGVLRKVTNKIEYEPKSVVEVRTAYGNKIVCTDNHPFLTEIGEETEAKDLVGHLLTVHKSEPSNKFQLLFDKKLQYAYDRADGDRVISVKPIREQYVTYDLSVEDDPFYVVEGVVSHNCGTRVRNIILNKNLSRGQLVNAARNVFKQRLIMLKMGFILTGLETKEDLLDFLSELDDIIRVRDEENSKTAISLTFTPLIYYLQTPLRWQPRTVAKNIWTQDRTTGWVIDEIRNRGVRQKWNSNGIATWVEQLLMDGGWAVTSLVKDFSLNYPDTDFTSGFAMRTKPYFEELMAKYKFPIDFNWAGYGPDAIFPVDILEITSPKKLEEWKVMQVKQDFSHDICLKTPANMKSKCFDCGHCDTPKERQQVFNRSIGSKHTLEDVYAALALSRRVSMVRLVIKQKIGYEFYSKQMLSHYISSLFLRRCDRLAETFYKVDPPSTTWASNNGQTDMFGGTWVFDLEWKSEITAKDLKPYIESINEQLETCKIHAIFDTDPSLAVNGKCDNFYMASIPFVSILQVEDALSMFDWQMKLAKKSMGAMMFNVEDFTPFKDQVLFKGSDNGVRMVFSGPARFNPYLMIATMLKRSLGFVYLNADVSVIDTGFPVDLVCKCGKHLPYSLTANKVLGECFTCRSRKLLYLLKDKPLEVVL